MNYDSAHHPDFSARPDASTRHSDTSTAAQYGPMFQNILHGYAFCQMLYTDGVATDFVYLDVNPSFVSLTGLGDPVGKRVSELIPEIKSENPGLFEAYRRVASGGPPEQFETYLPQLNRWFGISVYCPKPDHFVTVFDNITARKEKERGLAQSEAQYRMLAENMADVVWRFNLRTSRFTYVSPSVERLLGYRAEEIVNRGIQTLIEPATSEAISVSLPKRIEAFRAGDPTAQTRTTQFEQVRKDGSKVYTEMVTTLLETPDGDLELLGVSRDISERRKAERALEQSEAVLRLFVEHAPAAIAMLDHNMCYLAASRRYFSDYRIKEDSINGRSHYDVFPEIPERWKEIHRRCLAGSVEKCDEDAFPRADGSLDWLRWELHPWRTESGAVGGMLLFSEIITGRKEADQAIRDGQTRFSIMFHSSPVGIIMVRLCDQRCVEVNDAALNIFGYSREEFADRPLHTLNLTPEIEEQTALFERVHSEGKLVNAAIRRQKKDGTPLDLTASYERITLGGEDHVLAMFTDTTQAKRAERTLFKVNRALRAQSVGNEILLRAENEQQLMDDMCRNVVQTAGYRQAWIGLTSGKLLIPAAQFGYPDGFLGGPDFQTTEEALADGLPLLVLETGQAQIAHNAVDDAHFRFLKEHANDLDFESIMVAPLISGGEKLGVFCIYASETNAFDIEEVRLLSELAGDVAYGIVSLRRASAHEKTSAQLQSSMEKTIQAIATTLEMRDPYTAGHGRRVADLASAIAREMGLSEDQIRGIHMAAVIHDIGKVNIPAEILTKPTRLSTLEYELIKTHAQSGYEILKDVDFPWPIAAIVHQHHERLDGSGYPQGLTGDLIIEEAAIVAVADIVESMASHRPYRAALGIEIALAEIAKQKGILYDIRAVDACLRLFNEKGFSF